MIKYSYSPEGSGPASLCLDIKIKRFLDKQKLEIKAEIDTGANITSVPKRIIDEFDIIPTSTGKVIDFDNKEKDVHLYPLCLEVNSKKFEQYVIENHHNDRVLLGRDIINEFSLLLNGKKKFFQFL